MESTFMELIIQGGSWLVGILAAVAFGKQLIEYVKTDKENDRQDFKEDRQVMYSLMDKQNSLAEQQKDMIVQTNILIQKQIGMEEHNRDMLNGLKATMDKMNDIQMLHTNRLDRIEDKQEQLEKEIKKIGDKL